MVMGKTMMVELDPMTETADALCGEVAAQTRVPPDVFGLYCGGKLLAGGATLSGSVVKEGATLEMKMRGPGGVKPNKNASGGGSTRNGGGGTTTKGGGVYKKRDGGARGVVAIEKHIPITELRATLEAFCDDHDLTTDGGRKFSADPGGVAFVDFFVGVIYVYIVGKLARNLSTLKHQPQVVQDWAKNGYSHEFECGGERWRIGCHPHANPTGKTLFVVKGLEYKDEREQWREAVEHEALGQWRTDSVHAAYSALETLMFRGKRGAQGASEDWVWRRAAHLVSKHKGGHLSPQVAVEAGATAVVRVVVRAREEAAMAAPSSGDGLQAAYPYPYPYP